jgi:hypothetical protein
LGIQYVETSKAEASRSARSEARSWKGARKERRKASQPRMSRSATGRGMERT